MQQEETADQKIARQVTILKDNVASFDVWKALLKNIVDRRSAWNDDAPIPETAAGPLCTLADIALRLDNPQTIYRLARAAILAHTKVVDKPSCVAEGIRHIIESQELDTKIMPNALHGLEPAIADKTRYYEWDSRRRMLITPLMERQSAKARHDARRRWRFQQKEASDMTLVPI